MYLIDIYFSIIEIAVLILGAVILGLAIHFFIASRRSLKEALRTSTRHLHLKPAATTEPSPPRTRSIDSLQEQIREVKQKKVVPEEGEKLAITRPKVNMKEESVDSLKETIIQQQKLLNGFLKQVEEIENEGKEELNLENKHLQEEIRTLQAQLEKKEAEAEEAIQQASMAERMTAKIEEVYQEFEQLQGKMLQLEKQASRANNLAIELEDTRQAYEQIHKDLQRKGEKLEEVYAENQRLQHELDVAEDKLAEANLQRQQLQRKAQFLQDLNSDLQSMSDTNKKLQTELRRIGELESMLNMIAEERDYLLRKQVNK